MARVVTVTLVECLDAYAILIDGQEVSRGEGIGSDVWEAVCEAMRQVGLTVDEHHHVTPKAYAEDGYGIHNAIADARSELRIHKGAA